MDFKKKNHVDPSTQTWLVVSRITNKLMRLRVPFHGTPVAEITIREGSKKKLRKFGHMSEL